MKKVCQFVVLAFFCPCPRAIATPLVNFTLSANPSESNSAYFLYDQTVVGAVWAQSVPAYAVDIFAPILEDIHSDFITAYLLRSGEFPAIGFSPSPLPLDAQVVASSSSFVPQSFTGPQSVQFFSGLTLVPGIYLLILSSSEDIGTNGFPSATWEAADSGKWSPQLADGFELSGLILASPAAVSPLASQFYYTNSVNMVYQVDGSLTPTSEPSSLALFAVGVLGLAFSFRRFAGRQYRNLQSTQH
jgi:hypothetical protein